MIERGPLGDVVLGVRVRLTPWIVWEDKSGHAHRSRMLVMSCLWWNIATEWTRTVED